MTKGQNVIYVTIDIELLLDAAWHLDRIGQAVNSKSIEALVKRIDRVTDKWL